MMKWLCQGYAKWAWKKIGIKLLITRAYLTTKVKFSLSWIWKKTKQKSKSKCFHNPLERYNIIGYWINKSQFTCSAMSILPILTYVYFTNTDCFFCILILIYNNFIQICCITIPFSETGPIFKYIFKVLLLKPVIKICSEIYSIFPNSKISASNSIKSKSSISTWFILVLCVPLSNQMLLMRLIGEKNQLNRTTHLGILEDHFKSI